MENLKIVILNLTKVTFKNKTTGEVNEMVKVTYGTHVPDEERFSGMAILECYLKKETFNKLKDYIGKPINADFKKIRLNNGFKYTLSSIDNVEIN